MTNGKWDYLQHHHHDKMGHKWLSKSHCFPLHCTKGSISIPSSSLHPLPENSSNGIWIMRLCCEELHYHSRLLQRIHSQGESSEHCCPKPWYTEASTSLSLRVVFDSEEFIYRMCLLPVENAANSMERIKHFLIASH